MSDEPTARRSSRLAKTGAAIVEAIVPAKKRKAEGQKAAPKRQKKAEGAEVRFLGAFSTQWIASNAQRHAVGRRC